jgi:hypothetical protein
MSTSLNPDEFARTKGETEPKEPRMRDESANVQNDAPPLGKLYDVGSGRRLMLHHAGAGMPAVVIEAGAGAFGLDYLNLFEEVSLGLLQRSGDRCPASRAEGCDRRFEPTRVEPLEWIEQLGCLARARLIFLAVRANMSIHAQRYVRLLWQGIDEANHYLLGDVDLWPPGRIGGHAAGGVEDKLDVDMFFQVAGQRGWLGAVPGGAGGGAAAAVILADSRLSVGIVVATVE